MSAKHREFDRLLRTGLENVESHAQPQWNRLEHSLDTVESHHGEELDQIVTSSLNSALSQTSQPDWTKMEHLLERHDPISRIDQIIRSKLQSLGLVSHGRWNHMEYLIDDYERWHRRLISSRIIEMSILLFLLIYAGQRFFHRSSVPTHSSQPVPLAEEPAHPADFIDTSDINNSTPDPESNNSRSLITDINIGTEQIINQYTDRPSITLSPAGSSSHRTGHSEGSEQALDSRSHAEVTHSGISRGSEQAMTPISSAPVQSLDDPSPLRESTVTRLDREQHTVPLTPLARLSLPLIPEVSAADPGGPVIALRRHPWAVTHTSYGFFLHQDIYHIHTPHDEILDLPAFNRVQSGWGLGWRVHKRLSNWHIESGLSYRQYRSKPRVVYYARESLLLPQSFSLRHRSTLVHNMQIPIELQYDLVSRQRLRGFISVGAAAFINLSRNYEFISYTINNQLPTTTPIEQRITENPHSLAHPSAGLHHIDRNFSGGLLQGEGITGNSFLTGSLGAGLDYRLSEKISASGSILYHHRFNKTPVGPYREQIQTLSLNLGIRWHLSD